MFFPGVLTYVTFSYSRHRIFRRMQSFEVLKCQFVWEMLFNSEHVFSYKTNGLLQTFGGNVRKYLCFIFLLWDLIIYLGGSLWICKDLMSFILVPFVRTEVMAWWDLRESKLYIWLYLVTVESTLYTLLDYFITAKSFMSRLT